MVFKSSGHCCENIDFQYIYIYCIFFLYVETGCGVLVKVFGS